MNQYPHINSLLNELASVLEASQLNCNQIPNERAYQSRLPFFHDTMFFEQWLEFVFLPKMRELVASGQAPNPMTLLPALQVRMTQRPELSVLMPVVQKFDEIASC